MRGTSKRIISIRGSDTVSELRTIEDQLAAAWIARDQAFIERTSSDDWSVIDPAGRILTRAEVLKEAFTGERTVTEGKIDQVKVRDFGGWAIATGRTQMSGSYQGKQMSVALRFTDVFVRTSDEWQCVASQGTF